MNTFEAGPNSGLVFEFQQPGGRVAIETMKLSLEVARQDPGFTREYAGALGLNREHRADIGKVAIQAQRNKELPGQSEAALGMSFDDRSELATTYATSLSVREQEINPLIEALKVTEEIAEQKRIENTERIDRGQPLGITLPPKTQFERVAQELRSGQELLLQGS